MNQAQQVYERLRRANPLVDTTPHNPTPEDAAAFLSAIREGREPATADAGYVRPAGSPSRAWVTASVAFVAVLLGGIIGFLVADNQPQPAPVAAPPPTEAQPLASIPEVSEPVELANLREAVNRGDAAAAASVHATEEGCDRFFTTGVETCTDWYTFLVGIGTQVEAADCALDIGDSQIRCTWTVSSDAHRSLGIDSVRWDFLAVGVDRWGAVVPDGNLFSGRPGYAELDDEFWLHVAEIIEETGGDNSEGSNRVPATMNADLVAVVLEAAATFEAGANSE